MSGDIQKVLDKVAALRELAARAGTRAEAEAAAARADEILQRYRLTEADLEARGERASEAIRIEDEPLATAHRVDAWRELLAASMAKHYGCYVYRRTETWQGERPVRSFLVVGRASDVALLRYMYAWGSVEIARLSLAEKGRSARVAFCRGAAFGLMLALERAQRAATSSNAAAAMVLASRSALAEEYLLSGAKLRASRPVADIADAEAYLRGRERGERLDVSEPGAKLGASAIRMLGGAR